MMDIPTCNFKNVRVKADDFELILHWGPIKLQFVMQILTQQLWLKIKLHKLLKTNQSYKHFLNNIVFLI